MSSELHSDHAPTANASPRTSAGPLLTLITAILTLGLLPLILWPMRWAEFVQSERRDLLDLANWWRRRVTGKYASDLDQIVGRFKRRPMLMVLPWLAAGG